MKKRGLNIFILSIAILGLFFCMKKQKEVTAISYYEQCSEGIQSDGSYIIKVSSKTMKEDDGTELQNALWTAQACATEKQPYKIVVEPGKYYLGRGIRIYGNTCLYSEGVTYIQAKYYDASMLKDGDSTTVNDTKKGYYYKNITIQGGTWDLDGKEHVHMHFAHAKNLKVLNATFQNNKNSHQLEVAGIDGFQVKNCVFQKQILSGQKGNSANEAIQIDILEKDHFNGYKTEVLPTLNVKIENNRFLGVRRGVGSHTAWNGKVVNNVVIKNNYFENLKSMAVECIAYQNVLIENNTMKHCGMGIAIWPMRQEAEGTYGTGKKVDPFTLNAKTIVRNNTMTIYNTDAYQPMGINVIGCKLTKNKKVGSETIYKGNYSIKNVKIYKNTIQSKGYGIAIRNAKEISVYENKITCNGKGQYHGMQISEGCSKVSFTKNKIYNSPQSGIVVYTKSKSAVIDKNYVKNSKKVGICVRQSKVSSIRGNTISKAGKYGIWILDHSKVSKISSNKISGVSSKIVKRA